MVLHSFANEEMAGEVKQKNFFVVFMILMKFLTSAGTRLEASQSGQ